MPPSERAGAVLTIDLDAVADNWRRLRRELGGTRCAAVVKADGYGLGAERIGKALAAAGCDTFFVACLEEGVALREALADARIAVLCGPLTGNETHFAEHGLMPVLNHAGEVEAWRRFAASLAGAGLAPSQRPLAAGHRAPAAILHVDTGMTRLGLSQGEADRLLGDAAALAGIELAFLMSHLACADEPEHRLNAEQLARFRAVRRCLPSVPASLAASSGIFLGPDFRFDLARPGYALYGGNPVPGRANPMTPVVRLQARILQVREIDRAEPVGYGATATAAPGARLATLALGYADGLPRALSGRGGAFIDGVRAPFVGRVSMDLIVIDASAVPRPVRPGDMADLLGPDQDVDALAADAGTIGYEILTGLGRRYARRHVGAAA